MLMNYVWPVHSRSFPQCLNFLELLQDEAFRGLLLNGNVVEWLHRQQYYFWCKHGKRGGGGGGQEVEKKL